MSLKGDRYVFQTDITYFMNQVATRGGIVSLLTAGSGAALDQSVSAVSYAAATTGVMPVGLLLNDMVNYDLTRQHINFNRDEVQIGGKCALLKRGWVVTNNFIGTPVGGDNAYLTSSGSMLPYNTANSAATNFKAPAAINLSVTPFVGKFLSGVDEDGYAKVQIDL